jgi:hypothetical protein
MHCIFFCAIFYLSTNSSTTVRRTVLISTTVVVVELPTYVLERVIEYTNRVKIQPPSNLAEAE